MPHPFDSSSRLSRCVVWPIALLSAALAAPLAGCAKAGAGTGEPAGGVGAAAVQMRPLVVLEKTEGGRTVAVPLAEEYRHIRPAGVDGSAPPIAPAELWPAE